MDRTREKLVPIGTFASAAGLSLKALRLYDQLGILTATWTDPESSYRYYDPEQMPTARLIRSLRTMEMPLAMIRQVLNASETKEATEIVLDYQIAVEAHVALVRSMTRDVLNSFSYAFTQEETPMKYDIEIQDLPKEQVVSITQSMKVSGLSAHIGRSIRSLSAFVKSQQGEFTGAPFGIYHGPINRTDNGPLEVCFPVYGSFTASENIVVKELEASQVAAITITGDQCRFPAIVHAYDAAYDWINLNGYEANGPPREIWIGPDENGPMQIAWPFRERP